MNSVILATASRYLLTLILMFSVFMLLRGHNEPGGGFVGGLVAAAAFALYFIANGLDAARSILRIEPLRAAVLGLLLSLLSTLPSLVSGKPS